MKENIMLNKMQEIRNSQEEGFTLIELLVVVIIIGVIAAIAIPIFSAQQKQSIKAGIKSDVRNLNAVVQTYLVKTPDATGMGFQRQGDGPVIGTLATVPLFQNVPVSHEDAYLKVRGMTSAETNGGAWDGYAVLGYIDTLDKNSRWMYTYNSRTGKFVEGNQPI